MKSAIFLLLLIAATAYAVESYEESDGDEQHNDGLFDEKGFPEPRNAIFDALRALVEDRISKFPDPSELGDIDLTEHNIGLSITDLELTGLTKTEFILEEAPTGYNIDNLTWHLPELVWAAPQYKLDHLGFNCIFSLSGNGTLKITLSDFAFNTALNMSYSAVNRAFTVKEVRYLTLSLGEAKFELTNLGDAGDVTSDVLNDLISSIVSSAVSMINEWIQSEWETLEPILKLSYEKSVNIVVCPILNPTSPELCEPACAP